MFTEISQQLIHLVLSMKAKLQTIIDEQEDLIILIAKKEHQYLNYFSSPILYAVR